MAGAICIKYSSGIHFKRLLYNIYYVYSACGENKISVRLKNVNIEE